ncbi:MAG: phage tail protein [Pyrinomonadaceae bacterium]
MDVNGTRYRLLLGFGDWRECTDAGGTTLRAIWKKSKTDETQTRLAPAANASGLAWDSRRNELILQPRLFRFTAAPDDRAPDTDGRRGAARDRYGNWYWIDGSRAKVLVRSAGSHATTEFWSAAICASRCAREAKEGEFSPKESAPAPSFVFGGLAVTQDHYLVVGTLAPKGLLVFDLHGGGFPRQLLFPRDVAFEPFDMAARAGGGVLILDRTNARFWEHDRTFNVVSHDADDAAGEADAGVEAGAFRPSQTEDEARAEHAGGRERRRQITDACATKILEGEPVSIESLPDGSALVLFQPAGDQFASVSRYREGRPVGTPATTRVMLDLIEEDRKADFRLVAYDFAFVAGRGAGGKDEGAPDRLYVVASDGNQSYSFTLIWRGVEQIELEPEPVYLPMRLFGGKALVASGEGAHYDFAERWLELVEQHRPRYVEEAALLTPARSPQAKSSSSDDGAPRLVFDGQEPDCIWHRLTLDACIPAGASVRVFSRAANDEGDLLIARWDEEPTPYLRADGSELPYVARYEKREDAAKARAKGEGTWELLFQRARGRFLQLKLVLAGDGRSSPRLRALRAYYPRFSYSVNYLPGVYREDEVSASFLERFLANFEGTYTALEDKIAAAQILFDVGSAPSDALDWLAGWYGVALDPAWDEARRRTFIRNAMHFFAYRGTRHGLELALRLAFDKCVDDSAFDATPPDEVRHNARGIRLVEQFRARSLPSLMTGEAKGADAPGFARAKFDFRWRPADAAETLHDAYREAFALDEQAEFPVRKPVGDEGLAWKRYARKTLGFVPSATDADADAWRNFLARRYRTANAASAAHGAKWTSFDDVDLPRSLPAGGAALRDWYEFESVVVASRRAAHRFTVMLPVARGETFGSPEQRARYDLADRVVKLEKPAHTTYEIKFYWAMFRLGEARLDADTVLDYGSRAGALAPPLVVGTEHLVESRLAAAYPQDVRDARAVVGRRECSC